MFLTCRFILNILVIPYDKQLSSEQCNYTHTTDLQSSENRTCYHIIDGIEDKLQNFFEDRRSMISR